MDKPTFTPSLITGRPVWTGSQKDGKWVDEICHSYITEGRIQYLVDCTHAMAGQTVEIPDWEP